MPTNDFLSFAGGGGANVMTQADYAAATALRAGGFTAGTALSLQLNKVWRQSSIIAAVIAQLICDETGSNAADDGTTATLLADLKTAIENLALSQALGSGQTWQDFTSSRVSGVSYTAPARPIMVVVTPDAVSGTGVYDFTIVVDGVTVCQAQSSLAFNAVLSPVSFVVPPGTNYSVTFATGTIAKWTELR